MIQAEFGESADVNLQDSATPAFCSNARALLRPGSVGAAGGVSDVCVFVFVFVCICFRGVFSSGEQR